MKKIISLFSGIDCLGYGFKDNFHITLAVEAEKNACETLEANKDKYHPNMKVLNKDIYSISDEEILENVGINGIIGGPPCQAYSPAKGKFDPNDDRTKGIFEYLRWVKLLKPEFAMLENTFGLVQGPKKAFYDLFKKQFEELGYVVKERVLNAHDYGNVQNRNRLIVVGIKQGLDVDFKFPEPLPDNKRKYVRDIIKDEEIGECLKYSQARKEIISYVPEGGHWRNLPTEELKIKALGEKNYYHPEGGMTGTYRRLHRDMPCYTIVTNPCQRNSMAAHPTEDRPLSIKEYIRAQGLPEDYKIIGTVAEKYKYIANGVPAELARAISEAIDASFK